MTTPSSHAAGPLQVVFHTPVPVTFRTPVPISAASPIPVHVVNGPDSWAMTAAIAAVVAAVVAVVTLVAVLRQVKLARLEVGYVKRDLDNNERLLKELMRRPDLELTVGPTASTLESTPYLPVKLAFLVANKGTKVAHEVMVEVLIPVAAVYEESIDGAT